MGGATLAAVLVAACGPGPDTPPSFPGIEYPEHDGALPEPRNPVWLVGVDGATWDVIRPRLELGKLPNIARLVKEGTSGVLRSEEPMISPAIWATIATGVPRRVHGVESFLVRIPGSYSSSEVGPGDRKSAALWELVNAAGGRSTVISWFGSYPAEPIAGEYVSEDTDPANPTSAQVHPPELVERLPGQTVVRIPRWAMQRIGKTDFLRSQLLKDARTMAILEALDPEESDLVAVYFSGVDVAQHVTWKDMDPEYVGFPDEPPRSPELGDVIPAYYEYIDHLIGRVLDMMPEDATLIVVSDHGGGPMIPEEAFHLRLEVLLQILGDTVVDPETDEVVWNRTRAFAISERLQKDKHIWLNIEGVDPEGVVPRPEASLAAGRLRQTLEGLRTDTGEPLFSRIVDHTAGRDWRPSDPALTVRFSDAAVYASTFTDGESAHSFDDVRMRFVDVSGGHRIHGIYLVRGPRVRPGSAGPTANLYNVAPTILYLLGLPQDAHMLGDVPAEGGVLTSLLVDGETARHPVVMAARYPGTSSSSAEDRRDVPPEPAAEASIERLRALGYVQ
jgi:predicted AlkP superfamily phosphohydrolase/phosphomutase